MADEAYRAVFLRVHPTGKMVLSLTTESDGNEAQLRASGRRRARRPAARRQGRARRPGPVRDRARVQHEPVAREPPRRSQRHRQDPGQGPAARRRWRLTPRPTACAGTTGRSCRRRHDGEQDDRRPGAVRARHRRAAAGGRGRPRCPDRVSRLGGPAGPRSRQGRSAASISTPTSSATLSVAEQRRVRLACPSRSA